MSESAINAPAFVSASDATRVQEDRLPVGMAVLTIAGASGLLWLGIYAGFRYLIGA